MDLVPENTRQIDASRIRVLIEALKLGNTFRNSCAVASVDYDLARRWMAIGGLPLSGEKIKDYVDHDEAQEPYKTFAQAVRTAMADAESTAVANIHNAGSKDWRAAAFLLERRNPEEWGVKKESGNTVISSGGIQIFLPDNGRERPEIIEVEGTTIREISSTSS